LILDVLDLNVGMMARVNASTNVMRPARLVRFACSRFAKAAISLVNGMAVNTTRKETMEML